MARTLLVIAAIMYSGLPWEAAVGFPLDPSRSYLSELAARDQPSASLFRLLDASAGVLILVALLVEPTRARARSLFTASAYALGLFAAFTIIDASSPMACATSASIACARADAANTLGAAHEIHTFSSAGALAAVLSSAVLLALAVVRERPRRRPHERWVCVGVAAALFSATVLVTVLAMCSTEGGRLVDGGGVAQRAQVILISAHLVCFAVTSSRRAARYSGAESNR